MVHEEGLSRAPQSGERDHLSDEAQLKAVSSTVSPRSKVEQLLRADIEVLSRFASLHYVSPSNPAVMCVGAGGVREDLVVRQFHQAKYGIDRKHVKIAACTLSNVAPFGDYDLTMAGRIEGNAIYEMLWTQSLFKLGLDQVTYDMVYVRNPDLVNHRDWAAVFARSICQISPNGIFVTMVRGDDIEDLRGVLDILREVNSFEPVLFQETGISVSSDILDQHRYVVVFKSLEKPS